MLFSNAPFLPKEVVSKVLLGNSRLFYSELLLSFPLKDKPLSQKPSHTALFSLKLCVDEK